MTVDALRLIVKLALCFGVAGCATGGEAPTSEPGGPEPAEAATRIAARVIAPEPNALPEEYFVESQTLRVLGVEAGDGPAHAFAVITEIGTWATHEYRVGDAIGRGLRVARLAADRVELRGTDATVTLAVGKDTVLERIVHRSDRAATNLGKNRWKVDPAALADVRARRGLGGTAARVRLMDQEALKVSGIAPGGVLDRVGFHEGDLVLAIDGAQVGGRGEQALNELGERLTTSNRETRVTVLRRGSLLDLAFAP